MLRLLLLSLLLCGCSRPADLGNDDALFNAGEVEQPLSPGTTPVRIGEGGPRFAACGAAGQVVNLSPAGVASLTVRAAPFAEAASVAQLGNGARLVVCTRSMDQRWLGVVLPPADTPGDACGVDAPVASPRGYAGPCGSGWVESAFVRLGAR